MLKINYLHTFPKKSFFHGHDEIDSEISDVVWGRMKIEKFNY